MPRQQISPHFAFGRIPLKIKSTLLTTYLDVSIMPPLLACIIFCCNYVSTGVPVEVPMVGQPA
jgi:hypothetical protein